jgi:hypothetical protein
MKSAPYFLTIAVLSTYLAIPTHVQAEEEDIFTGPQLVDEMAESEPNVKRPKGALEPGGETLGKTAPLNGDRKSPSNAQGQSSRPESVRITREIRQQIIERPNLSTAAKNVVIITDDQGSVTLKGPVKTSGERQEIEQIARNNAQTGQVNNELVVKGEMPSTGGAHG